MHSRRALAHCAQMGRSSLHLSYKLTKSALHHPRSSSLSPCLVTSLGTAYLPLAAGEAVSQRKVSRFLVSTAHLTTTYHPVLDRGAIAALKRPLYTIKQDPALDGGREG